MSNEHSKGRATKVVRHSNWWAWSAQKVIGIFKSGTRRADLSKDSAHWAFRDNKIERPSYRVTNFRPEATTSRIRIRKIKFIEALVWEVDRLLGPGF
jgi:hypothetical protein